jgi:AbrB family transcriptional regulator (stage V sporulation protein T)
LELKILKSTGVIRRIDELGRIVIPKEIRRNLGIRDGENLEIFIEEDKIILQKQMVLESLGNLSSKLISIVESIYRINLLITDRDKVVDSSSNLNDFKNFNLNNKLIKMIDNRESYSSLSNEEIEINGKILHGYFAVMPIIVENDSIGLIIIINSQNKINQEEFNVAKLLVKIMAEKLSIC